MLTSTKRKTRGRKLDKKKKKRKRKTRGRRLDKKKKKEKGK